MLKPILKILIIFLITVSCGNKEAAIAPTLETTAVSSNTPSLGAHFPQTNILLGNTDLLVRGELTLDNGCLRVSETNTLHEDSFLLIWDSTFSSRTEQGVVHVIDSSTGEVLARVGDYVEVGGGVASIAEVEWALKEPIPKECLGPYWLVGEYIKQIDRP